MKTGNWPRAIAVGGGFVVLAAIAHSELMGDEALGPEAWIIRVIGCLAIIGVLFWILGEKYEGLK